MGIRTDDARAESPRPRGRRRGAGSDAGDTRSLIVTAASQEFARDGYEGTSMRAIARRAGVDPALVHHYFSEKAELFAESIGAPFRPDLLVRRILAGPREQIGENLVRLIVSRFDDENTRDRMVSLLHAALGQEFAATMLRQYLQREVLRKIAKAIGGDKPEQRAALAGSQIIGLVMVRYAIRVEPLASASPEEVVRRVGPIVQWHLTGDLPTLDTADAAPE